MNSPLWQPLQDESLGSIEIDKKILDVLLLITLFACVDVNKMYKTYISPIYKNYEIR